jgi:hypothetical protein
MGTELPNFERLCPAVPCPFTDVSASDHPLLPYRTGGLDTTVTRDINGRLEPEDPQGPQSGVDVQFGRGDERQRHRLDGGN